MLTVIDALVVYKSNPFKSLRKHHIKNIFTPRWIVIVCNDTASLSPLYFSLKTWWLCGANLYKLMFRKTVLYARIALFSTFFVENWSMCRNIYSPAPWKFPNQYTIGAFMVYYYVRTNIPSIPLWFTNESAEADIP